MAGAHPSITIVTPCLNGARYLVAALESVRRQRDPELEHVVIDGGSTDGTLELLARYPDVRTISEPDLGSHDALNKGVRHARGDVICFLMSDDILADGAVAEVVRAFAEDPALDTVAGRVIAFQGSSNGSSTLVVARDHAIDDGFWLPELIFGAPGFTGRFFHRRLFERIGGFDVGHYRFGGDRDFLLRLAFSRPKARTLPRPTMYIRIHSGAATFNPEMRHVAAFALENLKMSRAFQGALSNAPAERSMLAAWHAFEALRLLVRAPGRVGLGELGRALACAFRHDPFLPLRLPRAFALRAAVRAAEASSTRAARTELVPIPAS